MTVSAASQERLAQPGPRGRPFLLRGRVEENFEATLTVEDAHLPKGTTGLTRLCLETAANNYR